VDPDINLVLRVIQADDQHAFGELVKRHQSAVRNHLRALTKGDHARAEDLAQEAFVKAYRSIRRFRGGAKFSSWLFRIAYNTFLNDERRPARREVAAEEAQEPAYEPGTKGSDLSHDLTRALDTLAPEQAAVFNLHYKKGMTHAEVANTLQMPLGTVKSHLSRGIEIVRRELNDWKTDA
jgi:RNA polymerase sigma-70 factor (ECF subfamily)